MQTVRRLYFYAVSLISMEIIIWGLVGLLRTTVSSAILPGADLLSLPLALILVGAPIFLLHWTWAQRAAAADTEEHTSNVRALFLYTALMVTLIPAVSNLLAFINRSLMTSAQLSARFALLGSSQTWSDNLIAIVFNGIAAAYFYTIVRTDWRTLPDRANIADVRRLYRYIWLLIGLLMTIFGVQQLIKFLFYIPGSMLGEPGREVFINGLALALVGTPIWVYSWKICQSALDEPGETYSRLRLTVLYLITLGSVITVLVSGGTLLAIILRRLFGETMDTRTLLQLIASPLSSGIPLAAMWGYYGRILSAEITAQPDSRLAANLKRLYAYILSLIGLITTFLGAVGILSFIIDRLTTGEMIGVALSQRLANSLAMLAVGLPVWLLAWRPMQAEALTPGQAGELARQSIIRKAYLYLVLFISVIGSMISAMGVFYLLISAALGTKEASFTRDLLDALQILTLFAAVLGYHLASLRTDGRLSAGMQETLQSAFGVLAFTNGESDLSDQVRRAFQKHAARLPLSIQPIQEGVPPESDAKAVILPASLALNPPEALRIWLKTFDGAKIVIGEAGAGWLAGALNAEQAARAAKALAENRPVRFQSGSSSWTIVAYIFAILFTVQIIFMALGFILSLLITANY